MLIVSSNFRLSNHPGRARNLPRTGRNEGRPPASGSAPPLMAGKFAGQERIPNGLYRQLNLTN